jgi:drug/metabolite transporter (DMT)-like permease
VYKEGMTLESLKVVPALGWLLMSAAFFSGGEYFSKLWGYRPGLGLTAAVVTTYAIGTLCWLPALLHKNDLARMGTLWYLLTTPVTVALGVLVFKEKLSPGQWAGMGFAMVALWLLKD